MRWKMREKNVKNNRTIEALYKIYTSSGAKLCFGMVEHLFKSYSNASSSIQCGCEP